MVLMRQLSLQDRAGAVDTVRGRARGVEAAATDAELAARAAELEPRGADAAARDLNARVRMRDHESCKRYDERD
jgi:hypothetical protein